ncbi:DNA methyltransferase [Gordonia phage Love]|uniref:DNA methylase n=3 Tax=Vividuovirus TaxID=2560251 RepID=A0A7G8LDU1_9CAUD|nr:DNA methyltransferase [Gordonia phage Galadriel]YP_010109464.1 DNA methyltransferase [Gordonia phage Paries]YP_010109846.1 DNA methyltransferase [Gordonia phage Love]WNY14802.1 DNA methyltransferase [Gordonia phage MoontowerMania]QDH92030.1 methyltransferase [Gordonia phage Galadriel]QNJ55413.1 DNA methylase [Gordonia phage Paries]QNJ57731.1 methyltransferase [Gordonia phage Love]
MNTPYYSDGFVTLYHGDCLSVMETQIAECSIDVVLTDPPYSSGGRRENARSLRKSMTRTTADDAWIRGDAMSTNGFMHLIRLCGIEWRRVLKPGGHVLSFIDWRMAATLAAALETADLRQHPTLVWDKQRLGMGAVFRNQHEFIVHMSAGNPASPHRRDVPNVIGVPPVRNGEHPTEKPEPLLRTLLSVVATAGDVVLDPFAGSGATLTAAQSLGIKSVGVEADERYCEVIAKRLSRQTIAFDFGGS